MPSMTRYPIEGHSLLRRSFVHLPGVGPRTEARLWAAGVGTWDELASAAAQLFQGKRLSGIQRGLEASLEAWARGDLYFFHCALPGNERWRLIPGGESHVAYFDIEASGGGMPPAMQSTAVAFYFRGQVLQEHEHGRKRALIERMLAESSLLCTFNGAAYDVPFLAAEFGIKFAKAHVDMCPWLRRQGFKGGLKQVQRAMPHLHQRSSLDLSGFDAVRLWRLHEQGVAGALTTLLTYNAEDALILEPLLVEAFNREVDARPELGLAKLRSAPVPALATDVDLRVYALLRAVTDHGGHDRAAFFGGP